MSFDEVAFAALSQADKDARLNAALQDWTNATLPDQIRSMIRGGANPNARNADNLTPLLALATMSASGPKTYQALLDGGADLALIDGNGDTPLHLLAAQGSAIKEIRWMLGTFPLDTRNNAGETLLHKAAASGYHGSLKLVKLLVEKGADPGAKTNAGHTTADVAEGEAKPWLLEKVLPPMAENDRALLVAVGNGDLAAVTALLEAGANPCVVDISDRTYGPNNVDHSTALHIAMNKRLPHAIAELLVAKATDVNVRDLDGGTPLHAVCNRNDRETRASLVEQLLAKGADPNLVDKFGRPPVFELISFWQLTNEIEMLDRLAAAGANLAVQDSGGATMIDALYERTQRFNESNDKEGFVAIVLALLERGVSNADPRMRKQLDTWLSVKGAKFSSKITPAAKEPPPPPFELDLSAAGALYMKDAELEIEGTFQPVALFDWIEMERREEDDEAYEASQMWEYHIDPDLEEVVRARKLVPFGVVGMTGSMDSYEEISTDGTLFVIVAKAADGDAPVLYVPNDGEDEPRELAVTFKQLMATLRSKSTG